MPDDPHKRRIAKRIDADGKVQIGANWETLIERQIREAMESGKFNDLPRHGQPLPLDDNPYAGDMALGFHVLKNAGVAPPWVEADKEVRELLARRDAILERASTGAAPTSFARKRDREAIRALVTDANAAILKVNSESPTVAQHRRPLVFADEIAKYEAACRR